MEWLRLSGLQEEEVVQRVTRLCSRHFLGGRGPTPGNRVPVLFPYNDFCLAVPCKEIMPWEQSNASQESRNVGEAVEGRSVGKADEGKSRGMGEVDESRYWCS